MSTANVAKDLDLLRQAVGDEQLNFVGLSYGSFLGQTYANVFPESVGALVIDGVLDLIAWSNVDAEVPFSVALRSDVGALDTLNEFLRQCDEAGPGNCALAPNSGDRFDALLERLRDEPAMSWRGIRRLRLGCRGLWFAATEPGRVDDQRGVDPSRSGWSRSMQSI